MENSDRPPRRVLDVDALRLTSHHLRQLAKHGFIEEVPELARGRERWWGSARVDWRVPPRRSRTRRRGRCWTRWSGWISRPTCRNLPARSSGLMMRRARRGWTSSRTLAGPFRVTADELKEFFEEYVKLLLRYQRSAEQIPPGARPVATSFLAYPAAPPPTTGTAQADAHGQEGPGQEGGAAEEG